MRKVNIEVNNLSYSYRDDIKALDGISFTIKEGSYVCLVGHNGSGKSTLAKVLIGLLNGFNGSVKIFDKELNKENLVDIRSNIGIVFQNPDNQFVGSTVADDIAFGLENKQIPREQMQQIIDEVASYAGMTKFLNHEPQSLSGGQKQRVAIAGVLAMEPKIIILDEATAMLDPKGKLDVSKMIKKVRDKFPEVTIISITHDVEEANLADYIIVLNEGKVALSGSPEEVFSQKEILEKIKLDIPFVYKAKDYLKSKNKGDVYSFSTIEELGDYLCR